MAKAKTSNGPRSFISKPKTKRAGVHAKKKSSRSKKSKHYQKLYRGQGK